MGHALMPPGVGPGHGEEGVVGFRCAHGDARALVPERPDADPGPGARGAEVLGVVAQPEPDEVGLGRRHRPARVRDELLAQGWTVPPTEANFVWLRARSFTARSTRSCSSASAASEAVAAVWASELTLNGSMVVRTALATGSGPIRKPTRSPARPCALEKVRSTARFGWSRYRSMPLGTAGSLT